MAGEQKISVITLDEETRKRIAKDLGLEGRMDDVIKEIRVIGAKSSDLGVTAAAATRNAAILAHA